MKIFIILLFAPFLAFAEPPQLLDPWNTDGPALIKLHSMGFRWTQNLDAIGSKGRLFGSVKIKKYHKVTMAWEMGNLDNPSDIADGSKRVDAFFTEYEYFFH